MAKKKKKNALLEIAKVVGYLLIEDDLKDTFGETAAEGIIENAKNVYNDIKDFCLPIIEENRYQETIEELIKYY